MFPHEVSDCGPDLIVQELVRTIAEEEIESLSFAGIGIGLDYVNEPYFGYVGSIGVVVTDRALIHQFWEALRHASGHRYLNRVCQLFINLKETAQSIAPPILLDFSPTHPADCFGPDFQVALQQMSDDYAGQVSRLVSGIADEITEVNIANHIQHITSVTDPEKIRAIVQALTQLDGRAFAFTDNTNDSLWMRLHLRNSQVRDILLKVAGSELAAPPSLPPLLWEYYLQAIHWRMAGAD